MHKLSVFFVLIGLLFVETGRSEYSKNPPSGSCSRLHFIRKNSLGKPENVQIRQKNAKLAAAIAAAAQYFAQQQSPGDLPAPPADLVSISLACQQPGNGYPTVAEDRLTYGFTKIPVENPCYKSQVCQVESALEEASLHTINGEVMELNQRKVISSRENDLMDRVFRQFSRPPTLSDLGYVPAKSYKSAPNSLLMSVEVL